jgi:poly(3-hydroxyoctanoate) depolymerase
VASFWDPVRQRLPSSWNHRAIGWPGFGPHPRQDEVHSYDTLIDFIAGLITEPSVLVGQSMGGFVALQLALKIPERITHLVLTAAAAGVEMSRHGALDWRRDGAGTVKQPAAGNEWIKQPVPDLSAELSKIDIPVLLLWATADALSPLGVGQELERLLPNAQLITFPSDDHWFVHAHTDAVTDAIRSFVET